MEKIRLVLDVSATVDRSGNATVILSLEGGRKIGLQFPKVAKAELVRLLK